MWQEPPAQSALVEQGWQSAAAPTAAQVQTPFWVSQTSAPAAHWASAVQTAPHVSVTGSQCPLVQSRSVAQVPQSATEPGTVQSQVLFPPQVKVPQSELRWQASTHLRAAVSHWPVAHCESVVQVEHSAPVPVGATQVHWKLVMLQLPPGQSEFTWHCDAQMPLPVVVSQVPLWQSALTVHAEQAGSAHEQTLLLPQVNVVPQSALVLQPSTHLLVLVSQLPVTQSLFWAQVAHSAAVPVGAAQLQVLVLTSQVPPGQSALVTQLLLAQTWAVVSQLALWQSALAAQVEQAGAAHEQTLLLVVQVNVPQSALLLQPSMHLLVLPTSQLPVAQSLFWVHAAQSAPLPVGGTQLQVPLARSQVPPGQSALVTQVLAHLWAVVSQLFETQSPFTWQDEHAGAGGAVQPQVPRPKFRLQTKPPQSAEVRQPSVQTPVP